MRVQMLRGDGNWKALGLHGSMEGRILSTCDALLNCAPFWFRVRVCCHQSCTLRISLDLPTLFPPWPAWQHSRFHIVAKIGY